MERTLWYKDAVFYQIWPRSFKDSDGDGVGDLMGIYEKLDYIRSLHVDAIWFSPLYPSPNADYGYDVADYMDISAEYGGMTAFKKVLDGAHRRGMRVIMDLVVNHTSDQHPWFQASRRREEPYTDYYIWRKAKPDGTLPNNWDSLFEGKAWQYDELRQEYYLHLFAVKQADLNMDNPRVRDEVKKIMRFWLDMGVDGFREDVITFISKTPGLPSTWLVLPVANGMKHYSNRPQAHDYLREFKRDVLSRYDCFVVGESPLTDADTALRYVTEGPDQVLDEMIAFSHMEADCFMTDMLRRPFNLVKMKKAFSDWQYKLAGRGWNALYIENHDHPRIISRYGSERYRTESGKMLAAMYLLQKGTPFIYQGQEIGMTNMRLPELNMYKDVNTFNSARILSRFFPKKKVLSIIQEGTRENSRSPMQWDDSPNAGFTTGRPWFFVNGNYRDVNVQAEEEDPDSLLNFYRRLLSFRKNSPVVLRGEYREYLPRDKHFYVYERRYFEKRLLVICSFTAEQLRFNAPEGIELAGWNLELGNYDTNFIIGNGFTTRPYELRVYSQG